MQKKCLFIMVGFFVLVFPARVFAAGTVVINEFSPHPGSGNKEWVEFYFSEPTNLSNYWIDDDTDFVSDSGGSAKKHLDAVSSPGEHHAVFELSTSMFNNDGDSIVLFSPEGTVLDQYHYDKDTGADVSIGRTPDGNGGFQLLASATKGSPNSSPLPPATLTPAPTAKPVKQPTPTKVPTTAATKTKSTTSAVSDESDTTTALQTGGGRVLGTTSAKVASNGAYPTPILGASTSAMKKKSTPKPTGKVLVAGAEQNSGPMIALGLGVVLAGACGIIGYLKWRKSRLV